MATGSFFKIATASAALFFSASCTQAVSEPSSSVSMDDKAALEKIIHAYIVENPEVIIEALEVLEERRELASNAQKMQFLPAFLDLKNAPALGREDAPITIIEFFDYNCTFCKQSTNWVMSQVDSGDVRVVFMELPVLDSRNNSSGLAARASIAANMQGKYRELHIAMLNENNLSKGKIINLAQKAGLDTQKLTKDMESATVYRLLEDTMRLAEQSDILATPSFFVNDNFVSGANFPLLDKHIADARG